MVKFKGIYANVPRPAKKDQVGTKYTISQNGKYFELCA